jgi:hypothetical protein
MRTLRNIGIASSITALFLSTSLVFAQGKPANIVPGIYGQQLQGEQPRNNTSPGTSQSAVPGSVQQNIQERLEQIRERAAQQREKIQQKVQERVAEIQDKAKQQIASRLISQFDHINKVWTDHFAQLLGRYDAILQKIQERANIAASQGKDISTVTSAIQTAKTAITAAKSAVEAQAAKTYTPDISTAAAPTAATTTTAGQQQLMQNLRSSFKTLRDQLFKDLFALRDGPMTNVRKAVQSALQTLRQIPGVDQGSPTSTKPEGTPANQ